MTEPWGSREGAWSDRDPRAGDARERDRDGWVSRGPILEGGGSRGGREGIKNRGDRPAGDPGIGDPGISREVRERRVGVGREGPEMRLGVCRPEDRERQDGMRRSNERSKGEQSDVHRGGRVRGADEDTGRGRDRDKGRDSLGRQAPPASPSGVGSGRQVPPPSPSRGGTETQMAARCGGGGGVAQQEQAESSSTVGSQPNAPPPSKPLSRGPEMVPKDGCPGQAGPAVLPPSQEVLQRVEPLPHLVRGSDHRRTSVGGVDAVGGDVRGEPARDAARDASMGFAPGGGWGSLSAAMTGRARVGWGSLVGGQGDLASGQAEQMGSQVFVQDSEVHENLTAVSTPQVEHAAGLLSDDRWDNGPVQEHKDGREGEAQIPDGEEAMCIDSPQGDGVLGGGIDHELPGTGAAAVTVSPPATSSAQPHAQPFQNVSTGRDGMGIGRAMRGWGAQVAHPQGGGLVQAQHQHLAAMQASMQSNHLHGSIASIGTFASQPMVRAQSSHHHAISRPSSIWPPLMRRPEHLGPAPPHAGLARAAPTAALSVMHPSSLAPGHQMRANSHAYQDFPPHMAHGSVAGHGLALLPRSSLEAHLGGNAPASAPATSQHRLFAPTHPAPNPPANAAFIPTIRGVEINSGQGVLLASDASAVTVPAGVIAMPTGRDAKASPVGGSSAPHSAPSPTAPAAPAAPKNVVPPGWRLVTSNSTGKVYWYNKVTGKSTWQPPPGSMFAQDSAAAAAAEEEEGDGLPARSRGGKPVADAEGSAVPYMFAKPTPNGAWLTMRKEEAAVGLDSQRILLCAFEVDRVGMVSLCVQTHCLPLEHMHGYIHAHTWIRIHTNVHAHT